MAFEATAVRRSRFRGVVWCWKGRGRRRGKWKARVMVKGRSHHLGYFRDEEAAARAYDRAILELRGEALKLNFQGGDHARA